MWVVRDRIAVHYNFIGIPVTIKGHTGNGYDFLFAYYGFIHHYWYEEW